VVYTGGLSGIAATPAFGHMPYLAFILPVALVSGAVGGAGSAAQAVVRDVETGYLAKLALTPVARPVLVLAPLLSGLGQLLAQTLLILGAALLLGLRVPTGVGGAAAVVALTAGWGVAFTGFAIAVALRTGNGQVTQAATFVFFPLLFLSDTFVPLSLIHAHWMRLVIRLNPTTYVFTAMRALLRVPVATTAVWPGVLVVGIAIVTTTLAAVASLQTGAGSR